MERSWDYLFKTPIGFYLSMACAGLVLIFIVAGGIFMRAEIMRQNAAKDQVKDSETTPEA